MKPTEQIIDTICNSNATKKQLVEYLEKVEDDIAELFFKEKIDQEEHDRLHKHIITKAKEVLSRDK